MSRLKLLGEQYEVAHLGSAPYICNCLGGEDLWHGERGVEGHVGQHVDDGDQDAADGDGAGKVFHGVLRRIFSVVPSPTQFGE